MVRILICDDQDLVLEGMNAILRTVPGFEVVAMAHDGDEALEAIPDCNPDVVLMDLKMPGMNGVEATRRIRELYMHVHVLVITTYDADEWVFDAIRSGAAGYLLKDTPRQQLIEAIRGTAEGRSHVDPNIAGRLLSHISQTTASAPSKLVDSLSERERQVLCLLGRGLSNTDIASELYLSEGTVRNHLSSIFTKLDVTDHTQAAVLAIRYGLADLRG